jgi:hypothetical protein
VSYTLFLLNCSETLHNKLFSCLVSAEVTYSTSWRNIRGNDIFRWSKSDVPSGGSRFEISIRTLGIMIEIFVIFPNQSGQISGCSRFELKLVRAEFLVAKVERESFLLRCSLFCPFIFIPQCSMPIYVKFICQWRYIFLKSNSVCE